MPPQTAFRVGGRVVTRDGYYAKIVSILEDSGAQGAETFDQLLVLDVAGVGRREGVQASNVTPSRGRTVPTEVGKYTGRMLAASRILYACQRLTAASQRRKMALAFSLMHERLEVRKSERTATCKMLGRRTHRALFHAFDCYVRAVCSIVDRRDRVGGAIRTKCLHKAIGAWSDCIAKSARQQLEGEVASSKAAAAEAMAQIQALEEDARRKEREIISLQAADEHARKLKDEEVAAQAEFLKAAAALEERSTRHQEEMAQLQVDVDTVRAEKMDLEKALHGKEQCVQELNQRIIELTAELEGVQVACSKTKEEAADYAARWREEVGKSKASIAEAAEQLKARDNEAANLEHHLECLEHQLDVAETQLQGMHALKEELQHSRQTLREVSAKAEASEMAAERHRSEAAGLAAAMDDLQHEMHRLLVTDSAADHAAETPVSTVQRQGRRKTLSSAPPLQTLASAVASENQTTASAQNLSKIASAKQTLKHHLEQKDKEYQSKEEARIAEATESMRVLEEDVGRKEAEIASLTAGMEKAKQEASEYAKHLEGEVESGKATIAEATESMRVLEEDVGRKEAEIVSTKGPVSLYPNVCFAGLEVTKQLPHAVVVIDDLVDKRFVKQGDPGYSNPIVHVGDRILSVDGRPAEHVSVPELHGISLL